MSLWIITVNLFVLIHRNHQSYKHCPPNKGDLFTFSVDIYVKKSEIIRV